MHEDEKPQPNAAESSVCRALPATRLWPSNAIEVPKPHTHPTTLHPSKNHLRPRCQVCSGTAATPLRQTLPKKLSQDGGDCPLPPLRAPRGRQQPPRRPAPPLTGRPRAAAGLPPALPPPSGRHEQGPPVTCTGRRRNGTLRRGCQRPERGEREGWSPQAGQGRAGPGGSPADCHQVPPLHRGVASRDALPAGGDVEPP